MSCATETNIVVPEQQPVAQVEQPIATVNNTPANNMPEEVVPEPTQSAVPSVPPPPLTTPPPIIPKPSPTVVSPPIASVVTATAATTPGSGSDSKAKKQKKDKKDKKEKKKQKKDNKEKRKKDKDQKKSDSMNSKEKMKNKEVIDVDSIATDSGGSSKQRTIPETLSLVPASRIPRKLANGSTSVVPKATVPPPSASSASSSAAGGASKKKNSNNAGTTTKSPAKAPAPAIATATATTSQPPPLSTTVNPDFIKNGFGFTGTCRLTSKRYHVMANDVFGLIALIMSPEQMSAVSNAQPGGGVTKPQLTYATMRVEHFKLYAKNFPSHFSGYVHNQFNAFRRWLDRHTEQTSQVPPWGSEMIKKYFTMPHPFGLKKETKNRLTQCFDLDGLKWVIRRYVSAPQHGTLRIGLLKTADAALVKKPDNYQSDDEDVVDGDDAQPREEHDGEDKDFEAPVTNVGNKAAGSRKRKAGGNDVVVTAGNKKARSTMTGTNVRSSRRQVSAMLSQSRSTLEIARNDSETGRLKHQRKALEAQAAYYEKTYKARPLLGVQGLDTFFTALAMRDSGVLPSSVSSLGNLDINLPVANISATPASSSSTSSTSSSTTGTPGAASARRGRLLQQLIEHPELSDGGTGDVPIDSDDVNVEENKNDVTDGISGGHDNDDEPDEHENELRDAIGEAKVDDAEKKPKAQQQLAPKKKKAKVVNLDSDADETSATSSSSSPEDSGTESDTSTSDDDSDDDEDGGGDDNKTKPAAEAATAENNFRGVYR